MSYIGYKGQPLDFMVYQDGEKGTSVENVTRYYTLAADTPSKPQGLHTESEFTDSASGVKWSKAAPEYTDEAKEKDYTYYESAITIYSDNSCVWSTPESQSILNIDFIKSIAVTTDQLYAFEVASKKVEVTDSSDNIIFKADGRETDEEENLVSDEDRVQIGGFKVTKTSITSSDTAKSLQLNSDGTIIATAGEIGGICLTSEGLRSSNERFQVFNSGKLIAKDITIQGDSGAGENESEYLIKSDRFNVRQNGNMEATGGRLGPLMIDTINDASVVSLRPKTQDSESDSESELCRFDPDGITLKKGSLWIGGGVRLHEVTQETKSSGIIQASGPLEIQGGNNTKILFNSGSSTNTSHNFACALKGRYTNNQKDGTGWISWRKLELKLVSYQSAKPICPLKFRATVYWDAQGNLSGGKFVSTSVDKRTIDINWSANKTESETVSIMLSENSIGALVAYCIQIQLQAIPGDSTINIPQAQKQTSITEINTLLGYNTWAKPMGGADNAITVAQPQYQNFILVQGALCPETAGTANTASGDALGTSERRWQNIYGINGSFSGTVQAGTATLNSSSQLVSDRKLKNTLEYDISKYDKVFDTLKPVSYKYNDSTSNRTHLGFIAQDIQNSILQADLTTKDYAILTIEGEGFDAVTNTVIDEEKTTYRLRYDELHALEVRQIQLLKQEVKELKAEIEELKNLKTE